MKILIVGAGPTGLTAAVELARRGIESEVVDRRDSASTLSRAVGITPRSLSLLEPSGVSERLVAEGIRFAGVGIYRNDRLLLNMPVQANNPKYRYDFILGLPQDRTEAHLGDVYNQYGGDVRYTTGLTDLRQEGDQVFATFDDGSGKAYDYVIGADGVGSTTRTSLGLDFPGYDLPETWSIADVEVEDWPNVNMFTACLLPQGRMAVVVPLATNRYRLVSNTPSVLEDLPLPIKTTRIRREGQFQVSVRQVRQYNCGRVYLAGDAAHCHSPVGGRGMNLGIADSVDFARRLVENELEGYSGARHTDGRGTINGSERTRKIVSSSNPLVRAVLFAGLKAVSISSTLQRKMSEAMLYG